MHPHRAHRPSHCALTRPTIAASRSASSRHRSAAHLRHVTTNQTSGYEPTRNKSLGLPGNGGQFAAPARPEAGVALAAPGPVDTDETWDVEFSHDEADQVVQALDEHSMTLSTEPSLAALNRGAREQMAHLRYHLERRNGGPFATERLTPQQVDVISEALEFHRANMIRRADGTLNPRTRAAVTATEAAQFRIDIARPID